MRLLRNATRDKIEIGESRKGMVTKDETKIEQMQNDYELVFIVKPDVADDSLEPVINNVTQFIEFCNYITEHGQ